MSYQGPNEENIRWPSDKAAWTWSAFFLAVVAVCIAAFVEYQQFTPLQQWWFPHYLKAYFMTTMGQEGGMYRLLEGVRRDGSVVLMLNSDCVVPGDTRVPGRRPIPLVLSEFGAQRGYVGLRLGRPSDDDNEKLKTALSQHLYDDQTLKDMARPPLLWGLTALVIGLAIAIPKDAKRARVRQRGQRLRGPERVTVQEFNRLNRSDGIGFLTDEHTLIGKLLGRRGHVLHVPFDRESEHFMMVGDSGGGKSSLIRQMLMQIEQRGEIAIVNDPAREYITQFYDPNRGDLILNPLDARTPYWNPSDEVRHPAEANAIAESLFPEEPGEKKFFINGPRDVFSHLLLMKATPEEIIWCLSHEEEIKRIVKGTLLEQVLHPTADNQRAGVLGSLNLVVAALKLLPRKEDAHSIWTATDWSEKRQGWIFLTSTPETRKALLPLMSLWLDILVLRLIHQGKKGQRRVWFMLDELATLQHLPQLHTAITQNRKSNNPVVLGFHGRSQIERRYGLDAKAMMSSPATKFYLRTSEPDSAEWISAAIGDIVMARLRENRTRGQFPQERESISQQVDRSMERLVLPSEIGGLDDRHGYVKGRNLVVRISFPYIELPQRQPDLILRPLNIEPQGKLALRTAGPLPSSTQEATPATPPTSGNSGVSPQQKPKVHEIRTAEQQSAPHDPREQQLKQKRRFRNFSG
ncbi:MAG TPA: type IV secretion system DNA-binding domain-containing protein [Verrucomicrobiae bacterium]|jgi:hypothetical protein|nr:type IV secretion system DNA-binding domain-containing protein [Verrucomicrobiae bacterium]